MRAEVYQTEHGDIHVTTTLTEARESARNAARASLLAVRSVVDARIRRVERKQAAMHRSGATAMPAIPGAAPDDRAGDQHPHEIV